MTNRPRHVFDTLRQQGWWLLIVAMLIFGALWAFVGIADEVEDGDTWRFDRKIMLALHGGPPWLDVVARDITALGGTIVLTLLTVAAVGYLLLIRKWSTAVFISVSVLGGTLLSIALKHFFDRARPDLVPHAVHATSASFPSGHSMLAMTTFLTLGAVLAEVHKGTAIKVYILSWAVFLALIVGVSRVYLGVHWPTDVLGGWCLGSAWALLCATVGLWLQRHGLIESADA